MVHICALTSFSEGRWSTLLSFRSGAMFLTFHSFVHFEKFYRVELLNIRMDQLFFEVLYLALLPFLSSVVLVSLRSFVHLRPFLLTVVWHHFRSRFWLEQQASALG